MKNFSPLSLDHANLKKVMRFAFVVVFVCLARVVPHVPNFSPVLALCLWLGARCFSERGAVIGITAIFVGVFASDVWMQSFDPAMASVYLAFAGLSAGGYVSRNRLFQTNDFLGRKEQTNLSKVRKALSTFSLPVVGATFFFALTNLSVWIFSGMYSLNLEGFLECYTLALPFFRSSITATVGFFIVFESLYCVSQIIGFKVRALA